MTPTKLVMLLSMLFTAAFLVVAGITLLLFPPPVWSILWMTSVYGLPYPAFLAAVLIMVTLFTGLIVQAQWKKTAEQVGRRLDDAMKGTMPEITSKDTLLQKIDQLQEKLAKQTQRSQQIASEKASEREKSLQEVVVQERTRLARELHDSVSQQLFAASMLAAAINETNELNGETKKQFALVEKMINQSQLEMRALLLHLRPAALKGKSLQEGMQELLSELKQKVPLSVETTIEEVVLDKGVEDHLFRILQEAVSNSLRHADAGEMKVTLLQRDKKAILQVIDNGKGFKVEGSAYGSYGLSTMKERAEEVGGTLRIVSVPGEGTRIDVQIPILVEGEEL
nr:sensor histidine kinase [Alkalicoccus daliensis]